MEQEYKPEYHVDEFLEQLQSKQMQQKLVKFVKEAWQAGESAFTEYRSAWKEHRDAWLTKHKWKISRDLEYRSRAYLPWVYTACERWKAYMLSTTWPNDAEVFTIEGRTKDDHEGVEVYKDYLAYRMDRANFLDFYDKLLDDAMHGFGVGKVYWCETDDDQGVAYDIVCPDDFVYYPTKSKKEQRTHIHRSFKTYEELIATHNKLGGASPYINLDKIDFQADDNDGLYAESSTGEGINETKHEGLELKEAWVHRVKLQDEQGRPFVLRNVIITTVNDKYLIRVSENPYGKNKTPFIYLSAIPEGTKEIGYGLCHHALSLQSAANVAFNARQDVIKRAYPQMKYVDDGAFNPALYVARPLGLIEVGDINNLQPIQDNVEKLGIHHQEVESIKIEFEEATVSRLLKGELDEGTRTAKEVSVTYENASSVLAQHAKIINNNALEPAIRLSYYLTVKQFKSQAMNLPLVLAQGGVPIEQAAPVVVEMARVTQEGTAEVQGQQVPLDDLQLIDKLPDPTNIEDVDIKVVGYQNVQQRLKTEQALAQYIPQVAETPQGKYLDWEEIFKMGCEVKGMDDKRVMLNEENRRQLDQQEQQQQQAALQAQQEQQQFNNKIQAQVVQTEALKVQQEHEYKMRKLELDSMIKEQELAIDAAKADVDLVLKGLASQEKVKPDAKRTD